MLVGQVTDKPLNILSVCPRIRFVTGRAASLLSCWWDVHARDPGSGLRPPSQKPAVDGLSGLSAEQWRDTDTTDTRDAPTRIF